jgi:hypothetical protein
MLPLMFIIKIIIVASIGPMNGIKSNKPKIIDDNSGYLMPII